VKIRRTGVFATQEERRCVARLAHLARTVPFGHYLGDDLGLRAALELPAAILECAAAHGLPDGLYAMHVGEFVAMEEGAGWMVPG